LSLSRRHRDHEPWKAPASRTHSKRFAKSQALGHCAGAFGVRGASTLCSSSATEDGCSRFRTRFMKSLLSLLRMHWDHEPTPNPSREGNGQDADGCLLPSWEGSGVGRFMESLLAAPCCLFHGLLPKSMRGPSQNAKSASWAPGCSDRIVSRRAVRKLWG